MLKASEFVKVNKTKTLAKFITKFITAVKSFMLQASGRQRCKKCFPPQPNVCRKGQRSETPFRCHILVKALVSPDSIKLTRKC